MRKLAITLVVVLTIAIGLPYLLSQQWWGLIICLFAGVLWSFPSAYRMDLRSIISLIIFVILGTLGIFFNQDPLWSLTSFFLLLVTWDMDRYSRIYREFEMDPYNQNESSILLYAHLKRLLMVAGLGWLLGWVVLNIRVQISFSIALLLIVFLVLSLRQAALYLSRD
jgi:hypothetical protein